jgi:hypothetical protein
LNDDLKNDDNTSFITLNNKLLCRMKFEVVESNFFTISKLSMNSKIAAKWKREFNELIMNLQNRVDHVHLKMKQRIERQRSFITLVNWDFLHWMLKFTIHDSSSNFVIIHHQDKIIFIKKNWIYQYSIIRNTDDWWWFECFR